MIQYAAISFRTAGPMFYAPMGALALGPGDRVVVETARGLEVGKVELLAGSAPSLRSGGPIQRLVRRATHQDLAAVVRNKVKARDAFLKARPLIKQSGLPMKLVEAECTLDGSKVVLYFHAEDRVDFRSLVKELATALARRVELCQVGDRDVSKMVGGLASCGREVCAALWIREFQPVSMKMAKEQGLSLNPAKLSGMSGRLKDCLRYEYETYRAVRRELPPPGSRVLLPEGEAVVIEQNVAKRSILAELPSQARIEVPCANIQRVEPPREERQEVAHGRRGAPDGSHGTVGRGIETGDPGGTDVPGRVAHAD